MRKYIIVPVLLAVVLVMMCHCTSDRKATVPANEYLIQGELANLSDSIVIGLYVDEGNIFNLVARDTLLNGKFSIKLVCFLSLIGIDDIHSPVFLTTNN